MTKDYSTLEKKAKKGSAVAQHNLAYEYHKNHENKKFTNHIINHSLRFLAFVGIVRSARSNAGCSRKKS